MKRARSHRVSTARPAHDLRLQPVFCNQVLGTLLLLCVSAPHTQELIVSRSQLRRSAPAYCNQGLGLRPT